MLADDYACIVATAMTTWLLRLGATILMRR